MAVGIYNEGTDEYAFHGITGIEQPLEVEENTLFQSGSTGKTFTATAIMRLVEQGKVDLDATVRTYVPELRLKDEDVAQRVTILHLLNHTAGWSGDLMKPTGDGDDALEKYVENMAELDQITPLGETVSYNNASLALAGRVIEKVTGKTFEEAMKELIFEPLGLEHSFFFPNEIMTRRFAIGHNQKPDGTITVTRPWALPRGAWPAGGISTNIGDLLAWARFHLGDGKASSGTRVLSQELLAKMQQPTMETPGSALGDAVGIAWMLSDVEGVRLVAHGGDTIGHHCMFVMVPERDFAIACLTNCGPNGPQFNEELLKWALHTYLGIVEEDPVPLELDDAELVQYAGTYETLAVTAQLTVRSGGLLLEVEVKPEMIKQLLEAGEEEPPPSPPFSLGLLEGEGDRYIITDGPAKGMKGYFVRDDDGTIKSVHVGGRLAVRTGDVPAGVS